jgi:hypothetical protein
VVENREHPEGLVGEAKRVLKQDGSLVVSVPDKQTNTTNSSRKADDRQEMYVPEFQELLERHFEHVRLYRHGAVAGGFVFPASGEATGAGIESARLSLTIPGFGAELPIARSIIAVCSDTEGIDQEKQPYLLLDRDRRVFDECEERAEDVELLRGEIQQMQETEVQAFLDALKLRQSLRYLLNRYAVHLGNVTSAVRGGVTRRLLGLFRVPGDKNENS